MEAFDVPVLHRLAGLDVYQPDLPGAPASSEAHCDASSQARLRVRLQPLKYQARGFAPWRQCCISAPHTSVEEFTQFLEDSLGMLARYSIAGAVHFVCMDWRHMGEMLASGRRQGRQPPDMTIETLMADMPADWDGQRRQLLASSPSDDARGAK
jgi:hypothetical protein